MEMSERLSEIIRQNTELEKKTPFNFCDRWCERCTAEKQIRCALYLNEVEQAMTCVAHGKEPDDIEITAKVIQKQFEELDKILEDNHEDFNESVCLVENPETSETLKSVENNSLSQFAYDYFSKAHDFLDNVYNQENPGSYILYDLETVNWYHSLLPPKINRILSGFYAPDIDDFIICDVIAQVQICEKAIVKSTEALRKIAGKLPIHRDRILDLLALLNTISERITILKSSLLID